MDSPLRRGGPSKTCSGLTGAGLVPSPREDRFGTTKIPHRIREGTQYHLLRGPLGKKGGYLLIQDGNSLGVASEVGSLEERR